MQGDDDGGATLLTVRGEWDRALARTSARTLRRYPTEHPDSLILDLALLIDPDGVSAPVWLTAQRTAAGMRLPVRVALCIPGEMRLAQRLSVESARRLVARACSAWRLPRLGHAAGTVITEPVRNAIQHAGTDVAVVVSRRGTGLRLAVGDGSAELPRLPDRDEPGRGRRTVHSVAAAWGAMPTRRGKVVWAAIRPTRPR